MRKQSLVSIGILAIVGSYFMVGCAGTKELREHKAALEMAHEYQKPIMIRTSENDDRPKWTHTTVSEKSGKIYFSGAFTDGSDYALSIRCANSEALKSAIQAISQYIRSEFSSFVQGSNSAYDSGIERYVSDGIATFSDNIHVQGIRQGEFYYEEMFSAQLMQPTYNVFVRLEMTKGDYLKAKSDVLRELRDRFDSEGQIEAKEKAENLLKELKDEIKTST